MVLNLPLSGTRDRVRFQSDDVSLVDCAEARLAASLMINMATNTCPAPGGPVDPDMLSGVSEIQAILNAWRPHLKPNELSVLDTKPTPAKAQAGRVGTFFSGGVDSFFTLLSHLDEITDIIFIHGFDIPLSSTDLRKQTSKMIRAVGKAYNKRVIEIETDYRAFTEPHLSWGLAHGGGLAAVAHLLSHEFSKIFVPASHTYANSPPCGTHPLLDHHWGTAGLELCHDGASTTRTGKIAFIAPAKVVQAGLRVCWLNYDQAYNCGRCEKCLRTMISLKSNGLLEKFTTFQKPLRLRDVLAMKVRTPNEYIFLDENIALLKDTDADPQLLAALIKVRSHIGFLSRAHNHFMRSISEPWRIIPSIHNRCGNILRTWTHQGNRFSP